MIKLLEKPFFNRPFKSYLLFEEWELLFEFRFFKKLNDLYQSGELKNVLVENIISGEKFALKKEKLENFAIHNMDLVDILEYCRLYDDSLDWEFLFFTDHNFAIVGYNESSQSLIENNFIPFRTDLNTNRKKSIQFTFANSMYWRKFITKLHKELPELEESKWRHDLEEE